MMISKNILGRAVSDLQINISPSNISQLILKDLIKIAASIDRLKGTPLIFSFAYAVHSHTRGEATLNITYQLE